jgi:hypothetical protein
VKKCASLAAARALALTTAGRFTGRKLLCVGATGSAPCTTWPWRKALAVNTGWLRGMWPLMKSCVETLVMPRRTLTLVIAAWRFEPI